MVFVLPKASRTLPFLFDLDPVTDLLVPLFEVRTKKWKPFHNMPGVQLIDSHNELLCEPLADSIQHCAFSRCCQKHMFLDLRRTYLTSYRLEHNTKYKGSNLLPAFLNFGKQTLLQSCFASPSKAKELTS